jgi:hypothetical protein
MKNEQKALKNKALSEAQTGHPEEKAGDILARITPVHLSSGRVMLSDLIQRDGVVKRIRYVSEFETRSGNAPLHLVTKTIDRGLVFKSGLELKGIDPQVFSALGGGRN